MANKTSTPNSSVMLLTDNRVRVASRCPMCQHLNGNTVEFSNTQIPQVVLCDIEEGGCDRWYVIRVELSAYVTAVSIND